LSSTFFQEDKNFSRGVFAPSYPLFTDLLKERQVFFWGGMASSASFWLRLCSQSLFVIGIWF